MATAWPALAASARTMAMRAACSSWVPWEKFIRATSIPAAINCAIRSGVSVAGPNVATILVLRMALLYPQLLYSQTATRVPTTIVTISAA